MDVRLREPPEDGRSNRKARKKWQCESVEGPPEGVHLQDLPHTGCRHLFGGTGTGLKFCGIPSEKRGITYLCGSHARSYVRADFVPKERRK